MTKGKIKITIEEWLNKNRSYMMESNLWINSLTDTIYEALVDQYKKDIIPETLTLSIMQLEAFITLWLCKTRIEIEQLCKDNETLKQHILKSQLSAPMEAWHKIKEKAQIKTLDIEDCTILGYSWTGLKQVVDFAKSKGFEPNG